MKIGWLSPTGEMVECSSMDHISVAREIAAKYPNSWMKEYRPDDYLLDIGWVHITKSMMSCNEWYIYWSHTLTPEQINQLTMYFDNPEIEINYLTRAKWERETELLSS